jgi:hypothetical protein
VFESFMQCLYAKCKSCLHFNSGLMLMQLSTAVCEPPFVLDCLLYYQGNTLISQHLEPPCRAV